jgi:hypothetical protein
MLFATVGRGTPIWLILVQAFCYGALTSMQYTSINTLTYADVAPDRASNASSMASTLQQLSLSFGVAAAGLTTILFLSNRSQTGSNHIISGLHEAFLFLGAFTLLSTMVFRRLKTKDGADETRQKDVHLG